MSHKQKKYWSCQRVIPNTLEGSIRSSELNVYIILYWITAPQVYDGFSFLMQGLVYFTNFEMSEFWQNKKLLRGVLFQMCLCVWWPRCCSSHTAWNKLIPLRAPEECFLDTGANSVRMWPCSLYCGFTWDLISTYLYCIISRAKWEIFNSGCHFPLPLVVMGLCLRDVEKLTAWDFALSCAMFNVIFLCWERTTNLIH